jgi:hypothetical protein
VMPPNSSLEVKIFWRLQILISNLAPELNKLILITKLFIWVTVPPSHLISFASLLARLPLDQELPEWITAMYSFWDLTMIKKRSKRLLPMLKRSWLSAVDSLDQKALLLLNFNIKMLLKFI